MPDLSSGVRIDVVPPVVERVDVVPPASVAVQVLPVSGPPGPAGGATVRHVQLAPAATWTITHNLDRFPLPTLLPFDSAGRAVWTDLTYPDSNTLVIEWPSATAGIAQL